MTQSFTEFFEQITDGKRPRAWQAEFAADADCCDRFVPVGTGLGKTLGLAAAWFYHRIVRNDRQWPRRLAWFLPMRVLVEQSVGEFQGICDRFRRVSTGEASKRVPYVHVFLGGVEAGAEASGDAENLWHLHPERCAMLIGTQDMLLSRALARGYGAGRGRWPIDFALLQSDCLWVFDEVQLMGVGAVTGAQLQAFRAHAMEGERAKMTRPSFTWWASATLRDRWLKTVDSRAVIERAAERATIVPDADRKLDVFVADKPLTVTSCPGNIITAAKEIARMAIAMHGTEGSSESGCVTLVVLNRVDDAMAVADQIRKQLTKNSQVDVRLIHSRFRGRERNAWRTDDGDGRTGFLTREACESPSTNRIIVATQVVEAGVDISAGSPARGGLLTEVAPWSSMVQRFGRAARYGGTANVTVIDRELAKNSAAPYDEDSLAASLEALAKLDDVGLNSLHAAEQSWRSDPDLDARLFRLDYQHLLRKSEFDELFDTSPDLTGDDIDISRFIREGEETNAMVCWIEAGKDLEDRRWQPPKSFAPEKDDLCPVPFLKARDWLFDAKRRVAFRKIRTPYAYVWDFDDGTWKGIRRVGDIIPGATVLVDHRIGGYLIDSGFVGTASTSAVELPVQFDKTPVPSPEEQANRSQESEALSVTQQYQSIADHGRDAGDLAAQLAEQIGFSQDFVQLLRAGGRWHDWGKCHPVFRGNIINVVKDWRNRDDIAKAPPDAWRRYFEKNFNWPEESLPERFAKRPHGKRKGFRHELATVLGLFELLARANSRHPALRGSDATLDELFDPPNFEQEPDHAVTAEIEAMAPWQFNLLLYLVAGHHGKVRCELLMTADDQEFREPLSATPSEELSGGSVAVAARPRTLPIRGVCAGDRLPSVSLNVGDQIVSVPAVTLHTDVAAMGWGARYGPSWSERVIELVERIGPYDLALLEAILRAADVRCSKAVAVGDSRETSDTVEDENARIECNTNEPEAEA